MATIYISYRTTDQKTAIELVSLLEQKQHRVRCDQEFFIGSAWREQLMDALLSADAVVVLWSEETYQSQYVAAEVGAARASRRMALLPVMIGTVAVPPFIQDLTVERILDAQPETLKALAEKLDQSIQKHTEYQTLCKKGPKLFISHRHKDEAIVRALIDCLTTRFGIKDEEIRCTSVRPYRLPVGDNTADRLRSEISNAEVVLGILTPDTLESTYVAFELGAAWGQGIWTCPLLAQGANYTHIPDPIRDRSSLSLENADECFQFLEDLTEFTSLKRQESFNMGVLSDRVRKLVEAAKKA